MGLAKEKMFGKKPSRWPNLQKLVDKKVLLPIDLAYAQEQHPNGSEKEIATQAALIAMLRKGHLCLQKEKIEDPYLANLVTEGASLPKYAYFEEQIVFHLKRILSLPKKERPSLENQQITEEQNQAIVHALTYPVSIITGGPGTGKTFTASQIAHVAKKETLLTAPTGKAASHLESKIKKSVKAGTLHSILKIRSPLDFLNPSEPLEAELVIVDECSMIDPLLFAKLLSAISSNTTLVLMGDQNQLPAVEGGSIFSDLIASKTIPTTILTKPIRSNNPEILELSSAILSGKAGDIRNVNLGFEERDLEKIYTQLWEYVRKKDFSSFRILSTLRKGPLGVDALNDFLYEKFSHHTDTIPILIKKNDVRTGLCNGDTGVLIDKKEARFSDGRSFPCHELPPYEYAYCLSVHKSQGSEYEDLLFLIPTGSEKFGRELLYTGVTRAKNTIAIDGDPREIKQALARSSGKISGIREKLKG